MSRIARFRPPSWALALLSQVLACLIAATATAADLSVSSTPLQSPPQEEPASAQHEATKDSKPERIQFGGDVRLRANSSTTSDEGVKLFENGEFRLRVRLGLAWVISKVFDFKIRAAGSVSSDSEVNTFNTEFDTTPSIQAGMVPGQATFDEFYFKVAPGNRRFNLYAGRFQAQFQLQGVFPKSLDKKDSNNMRITWTDGLHLLYRGKSGWSSHFIAEYQDARGPTDFLREPLDFNDDDARVSYFLNVRSDRRFGPLVQSALDVTYLPAALLKTGLPNGPREDYWAALIRASLEWHLGESTKSILAGGEIGYAPETPFGIAVALPGMNDTNGFAWQAQVSLMNFKPGHSIGLNVGVAEAGWLISPQFRPNEELAEIRYRKLMRRGGLVEIRVRYREQIDAEIGELTPASGWDGYARWTRSF